MVSTARVKRASVETTETVTTDITDSSDVGKCGESDGPIVKKEE